MKISFYGHATFMVEIKGKKILFDPFITHNPLAQEANISADSINPDYILISHGHADHIADAVGIATRTGAKVVANWEIHEWLNKQGVQNTHPMNTGGKWTFDEFTVNCTVAQHSSGLPDGSYGGNPMGFVITSDEGNFYYSGDTALTLDMQLIPMLYSKLDFALMPIGDNFTMNYEHAVIASDFIKCNTVVGLHFDTFGFIVIDHDAAKKAFSDKGKTLFLPKPGMNFSIEKS
jgi:L-ascorbate metabolism protein UlaG (beta-lactamase superfamily)